MPSSLRTSRFLNTEFVEGTVPEMRALKTKHEPDSPDLDYGFDFFGKADDLYMLLMPRLPTTLGTEIRQVGRMDFSCSANSFRNMIPRVSIALSTWPARFVDSVASLCARTLHKQFALPSSSRVG